MKTKKIVLMFMLGLCCLTGCVSTNYHGKKWAMEDSQLYQTEQIDVSHVKVMAFDKKDGLAVELFDGSTFGVQSVTTDPDEDAIKEAGKAVIEAAATGMGV